MEHIIESGIFVKKQGLGAPIVYIHGLGESSLCFESFCSCPELSSWSHWMPDLPGYGKSSWLNNAQSLPDYANLLNAWITSRFSEPVILAGHSMGGVIGQLYCESHLVRAFINIEGNISIGDCIFSGKAASQDPVEFASTGFRKMQEAIYKNGRRDSALQGYYASLRLANPAQFHLNSKELVEFSKKQDGARRFANLQIPILYIAGVPDGICKLSHKLLKENAAPLVKIRKSGHWPFIAQEQETAYVVARFLKNEGF